jgi:hypothetical protein
MSFITESKLKEFGRETRTFSSLNESLMKFKNEPKSFKTTIFLSHKHDEAEVLNGAISFLKEEGVDVYVDWLDEGMPKYTSGITAKRIKEKIKENDKFIFLATEGAINSKWCNWELGLGDAAKYIKNIALLPTEKDNLSFSGSEYLQIYPYIEYQNGLNQYSNNTYIPEGYYVRYPLVNESYSIVKLSDWLKK